VERPVFRFAPSPTGRLHRGHAFSALTARRAADAAGGLFRLRIEDIDRVRCRPEFEAGILEDLAWLGLAWDGPVLRQSERGEAYAAALARLEGDGLAYRCFRTRREVAEAMTRAPHGEEPGFFGQRLAAGEETARLDAGEAFAWRLLEEEHVVTMPGESFGTGGAGHLRVALTVGVDEITEASKRIVRLADRI